MSAPREPIALYVHWPWCLAKCPYCDFNSRAVAAEDVNQAAYRAAITAELNHYASITNNGALSSIFFGGGTPSLMSPDTVAHVSATATTLLGGQDECEITLDAYPTSVAAARFRGCKEAGVNRVSVGVQALNDEYLQALGREHSAVEARRALDIAGAVFERFTFDLIYARPGQSVLAWEDELDQALSLGTEHISLYQLTIEPGTEFFRDRVPEAGEDVAVELYQLTQERTAAAGLAAYEVSNHARPGAESRHNLTYWRGGNYVGVGPGAHGRIRSNSIAKPVTSATHQIADPARWLDAVNKHGHGTAKTRTLPAPERATELLLAGLRLAEGVDRARFSALTGLDISEALDPQGLEILSAEGLITLSARTLYVSPEGRLMLNGILQRLLA